MGEGLCSPVFGGRQGLPPPMCSFQKLELGAGRGHLHSGPGHSAEVLHHVISFLPGVVPLRYIRQYSQPTLVFRAAESAGAGVGKGGAVGYTVCL